LKFSVYTGSGGAASADPARAANATPAASAVAAVRSALRDILVANFELMWTSVVTVFTAILCGALKSR
jgi:hypothetical protein